MLAVANHFVFHVLSFPGGFAHDLSGHRGETDRPVVLLVFLFPVLKMGVIFSSSSQWELLAFLA